MPLLFYLPLIVWMGMFEAMQDQMRVPAAAKAAARLKSSQDAPFRHVRAQVR
jgi:hypothetical protein